MSKYASSIIWGLFGMMLGEIVKPGIKFLVVLTCVFAIAGTVNS